MKQSVTNKRKGFIISSVSEGGGTKGSGRKVGDRELVVSLMDGGGGQFLLQMALGLI